MGCVDVEKVSRTKKNSSYIAQLVQKIRVLCIFRGKLKTKYKIIK